MFFSLNKLTNSTRCLTLFYKLYSTNSTVEQLHKKLEFVEYLFRCSYNSTLFY